MTPDGERAIHGSVEDGPDHGVEAVGRQVLGGREKVAGGVVDQPVDPAEPLDGARHEPLDLLGVAHVGRDVGCVAPFSRAASDLLRGGGELLGGAARDRHAGAVRREGPAHREPSPLPPPVTMIERSERIFGSNMHSSDRAIA